MPTSMIRQRGRDEAFVVPRRWKGWKDTSAMQKLGRIALTQCMEERTREETPAPSLAVHNDMFVSSCLPIGSEDKG